MTAAFQEEPQICLFVKQKIDDYGLDVREFWYLYTRISRRAGNGEAWSLYNMARACYVGLSQARTTWRLLYLAENTQ